MNVQITRQQVEVKITATEQELMNLDRELNEVYEESRDPARFQTLWQLKDLLVVEREG